MNRKHQNQFHKTAEVAGRAYIKECAGENEPELATKAHWQAAQHVFMSAMRAHHCASASAALEVLEPFFEHHVLALRRIVAASAVASLQVVARCGHKRIGLLAFSRGHRNRPEVGVQVLLENARDVEAAVDQSARDLLEIRFRGARRRHDRNGRRLALRPGGEFALSWRRRRCGQRIR